MPPASRLGDQIQEVIDGLARCGTDAALIGGLALASHHVIRATQDVDLLIPADRVEATAQELARLGYRCIHQSDDVANFLRGDERVDLLLAHRPAAVGFLRDARAVATVFGSLKVVSAEALIALKLQGYANDPRRTQDIEDIRALLRANRESLNLEEVRRYFALFGREDLLDDCLSAHD